MMSRIRASLLALSLALWSAAALAQGPSSVERAARDMIDASKLGYPLEIPVIPDGYATVTRGSLSISYPLRMAPLLGSVLSHAEGDARSVAAQLGLTELPALEVRLVPDAETLSSLSPRNARPPAYAVGVAYPSAGLALVSATAPVTREASNIRQVLKHELSHLLLGVATRVDTAGASGGSALPRWLAEGLAVEQAGEHPLERFEQLALASFSGRMLPLRRLDAAFSSGPSDVNVAYAQSADFVNYLLKSEGTGRFAVMLGHVRQGLTFEDSVRETYGVTLAHIEDQWRSNSQARFALAPLWAGTSAAWVLGAGALVVAAVKRRRKSQKTLERWAREERRPEAQRFTMFRPGAQSKGSTTGKHTLN